MSAENLDRKAPRYDEHSPPAELAGVVACVWTNRADPGGRGAVQRVVPDACMDLIWTGTQLQVAGPDTRPLLATIPSGATFVGVRFLPGAAPAVLGVPASALRNLRVPLQELWPRQRVDPLTAAAGGASASAVARLLTAAVGVQARERGVDAGVPALVAAVAASRDVASAASALGVGERRLHRRCLTAVGYGPKVLQRILRFQRALALTRAGLPLARVAAESGYADQAHLARDVSAFAGVPPSQLRN